MRLLMCEYAYKGSFFGSEGAGVTVVDTKRTDDEKGVLESQEVVQSIFLVHG